MSRVVFSRGKVIFVLVLIFGMAAVLYTRTDGWQKGVISLNRNMPQNQCDMVLVDRHIPGVIVDLRYAGSNNIFGAAVYESGQATLRRGTADLLKEAESEFEQKGYRLKVWDAYRSPRIQFILWEKMPDERFVVNPNRSFSYHSRGAAVDVTLTDEEGREVLMPSDFDEFGPRANRDYSDVEQEAARNAVFLEEVMKRHGFRSIFNEWWHFADEKAESYPVLEEQV